jgi:hypothetical protein
MRNDLNFKLDLLCLLKCGLDVEVKLDVATDSNLNIYLSVGNRRESRRHC